MTATRTHSGSGLALVILAAVLWGTIGPAQKLADSGMSAMALAGWRHVIGAALLGLFAWAARGRAHTLAGSLRTLVAAGAFSAAYQATFLASVERSGAGMGTVVAIAAVPPWTALLTWLTGGGYPTRRWITGSAVAVVGCAALILPGADSSVTVAGLGVGAAAGLFFALYTTAAKRLATRGTDPMAATAATMATGAVLLAPWWLFDSAGLGRAEGLALALWLGVGPTAVAYAAYARGLRDVDACAAGTLTLVEPLTAAALGALLVHERMSSIELFGCTLIIIGLFVTAFRPRRPVGMPATPVADSSGFMPLLR